MNSNRRTPMATQPEMIAAVQSGDVATVRTMLQQDPALGSAKDANGVSAVMHAFYAHQPQIAELLVAAKADLDIFEATAAGRQRRVSEILDGDPGAAKRWSADGFTALHFAAFFNRDETARDLIRHGAEVDAASHNAMKVTPLHSAAAAHSREIVRLLLEQGASADARQQGGWTALHAAAQDGDVEMVRDLLQHRADVQARNDDGKTPTDIAAGKGHTAVVQMLSR
jgi:uncharacterized protein